jgi:hypothetical protein
MTTLLVSFGFGLLIGAAIWVLLCIENPPYDPDNYAS